MKKQCKLGDVKRLLEEIDFSEIPDDVVELEEGYQLVLSGWYVNISELHLRLHEGVVGYWDEKVKEYMPDFSVTVIYSEDSADKEYLYYEQDEMMTTMFIWLHGRMVIDEIEQLVCEIVIPYESNI